MECISKLEVLKVLRDTHFFQGKKYVDTLAKSMYITISQVKKKNPFSLATVEQFYNIFLEGLVLEINKFFLEDPTSEEMLVE